FAEFRFRTVTPCRAPVASGRFGDRSPSKYGTRVRPSAPAGADGLTLVPYFEGERSPNLPDATGALHGVTVRNLNSAN
ncbi:hypothetical protein C6A85_06615, partial [Mycobacterium sp. ITM-2017-0098]